MTHITIASTPLFRTGLALLVTFVALSSASAQLQVVESPVTTNASDQIVPDVFGNNIVWEDYRDEANAGPDLWGYDLSLQSESPLVQAPEDQWEPSISGVDVVFQDNRDPTTGGPVSFDIWQVKLGGSAVPITKTFQDEAMPHTSSGRVVFEREISNGNWNILSYDLGTGVFTTIAGTLAAEQYPVTSGNFTVYSKFVSFQYDLYGYNHTTGATFPIATGPGDQWLASTDGHRVVWEDWRNAATAPDIYMYDLATGVESPVTTASAAQYDPVISGSYICWWDRKSEGYQIRMLDLNTGVEQAMSSAASVARFPNIHEATVVWQDRRSGNSDIWMGKIGPDMQQFSSIGLAKLEPDDSGVTLDGRVVTRVFADLFAMSDPDRAAGVLVKGSWGVQIGDLVSVKGVLDSLEAGDRIVHPAVVYRTGSTEAIEPLGMSNNTLGGQDWGSDTAGPVGRIGLNNTGSLVRVWGRVTSNGSGWFYIDDGLNIANPEGTGVRVECGSATAPAIGTYVGVTGISSLYKDVSPSRMIRVASAGDIMDLGAL